MNPSLTREGFFLCALAFPFSSGRPLHLLSEPSACFATGHLPFLMTTPPTSFQAATSPFLKATPPTSLRSATSPFRGGKSVKKIEDLEGLSRPP